MKIWQKKNIEDGLKSIVYSVVGSMFIQAAVVAKDTESDLRYGCIIGAVVLIVFAIGYIMRCTLRFIENEDKEVL
jgi:hypothetical protein